MRLLTLPVAHTSRSLLDIHSPSRFMQKLMEVRSTTKTVHRHVTILFFFSFFFFPLYRCSLRLLSHPNIHDDNVLMLSVLYLTLKAYSGCLLKWATGSKGWSQLESLGTEVTSDRQLSLVRLAVSEMVG